MINEERLVKSFMDYVQVDSPSGYEKDFADVLKKDLEDLGFEVRVDQTQEETESNSGNLIARLKGQGGKPILFSCHMDTVSPGRGIKPSLEGDRIVTDGTTILGADDKSAIASIIEALTVIRENKLDHGDIELSFTVSEEIGIRGAKATDYSIFESKNCYVLDTGGRPGKVAIQGPAHNIFDIHILGKASHAGSAPEKGISAIMIASEAIAHMKLLRIDEETTANIGTINGGLATNILAENVHITAEARSLSDEKLEKQTQHMVKCFKDSAAKYGGQVKIDIRHEYPAFSIDKDSEIVTHAFTAIKSAGLEPHTGSVGGGSDGNIINAKSNIKAVTLSNGGYNAHSTKEYIDVVDLVDTSRVVLELIKLYSTL